LWPALTNELVDAGWRSFLHGDEDRIWFWKEDTQTASWHHPGTGDACFRRAGKYVSVPAREAGPPPLIRRRGEVDDSEHDETAESGVGSSAGAGEEKALALPLLLPILEDQALPVQATSGAASEAPPSQPPPPQATLEDQALPIQATSGAMMEWLAGDAEAPWSASMSKARPSQPMPWPAPPTWVGTPSRIPHSPEAAKSSLQDLD